MRLLLVSACVVCSACGPASVTETVAHYTYEIVQIYPHDRGAFTEGLFYWNGFLYESTGLEGRSSIRKVKLETGETLQKRDLPDYFGEGIVNWKDKLYELTWKTQIGFIYDFATFQPKGEFHYPGEGWALTSDGRHLIMSDGTPQIRYLDPDTLAEISRLTVTESGQPVWYLNEVEWVKGEIYANVWKSDYIVRINPISGKVTGKIDLTGILRPEDRRADTDVLNGIAYDAEQDRLFVTGKCWPKLFQIKLLRIQPSR